MNVVVLIAILIFSNEAFSAEYRITEGKNLEPRPEIITRADTCSNMGICTIHHELDWVAGGLSTDLIVNDWRITDAVNNPGYFCKFSSPEITYKKLQGLLRFDDEDIRDITANNVTALKESIKEHWRFCNVIAECHLCSFKGLIGLQDDREYLEPIEADAYIETDWLIVYIDYLGKTSDKKSEEIKLKAVVVDKKDQAAADIRGGRGYTIIDGILEYLRHN